MDTALASRNPFETAEVATRPQAGSNALVDVEQQRALAEVQSAIVLAKKFPRNQIEAMDKILVACQRQGLAEQAVYSYARGGSAISGPSIRLAEAIAQAWGNLQFGIKELEQRNGESTVQAYAWDMESNTRQEKTFQVKHERFTKKGKYKLEDPRDVYEAVANQGARRLRACILGVLPGDVIDAAVAQCEETMKAKADTSPAAIKKMVEAFEAFKVTKEQIEKRIQRHIDAITPAQIVSLKKIYTSLRDGMSVAADWFEPVEQPDRNEMPKTGAVAMKDKLKAKQEDDVVIDAEPVPDRKERFECPQGGFATSSVCKVCEHLTDKSGERCPAAPEVEQK